MRVEPGVISKGVSDHHKAWNPVRKAKHSTKKGLKTFPCTMAKLCQKLPVVFEIDPEKNGYAENKLPVGIGYMKHFSNRPQLGFCCQYQINLAAPGREQFAASIVGNCHPSEKNKIFSLEAISYHLTFTKALRAIKNN